MLQDLQNFYLDQAEPNKSCLLTLRQIILAQDPEISETRKYGMPCFCFRKKAFCYLWTDKKTTEPYLLLVEGMLLKNPDLETGDRSRMKIFRVNPAADLPLEKISEILNGALDLYRQGIIKTKG
ncbi:DUF1801 domain-containing protein [Algoriphagus sp. A40]|uniref:DUF1801 domain-containing protein n=1 Tax=Algoriphagus sp. A40 TaxID=1945863 RepID=UPI0009865908|nr:DUF1801 domain-containing protein [Algoriphagus sp. A40]OOG73023.1 hypothetical protein B0E43_13940 [Algoriphagus sp. A40]